MKKFLCLSLTICILALCLASCGGNGNSTPPTPSTTTEQSESVSATLPVRPVKPELHFQSVESTSVSALVYNVTEKDYVYEYNVNEKCAPASLTKLMTTLVAITYVPEDTVFTVGSELSMVEPLSSICMIRPGHQLTLKNLLYGMLLASGNDAAYTVAVNTARFLRPELTSDTDAVSYFVQLMNDFCLRLGMTSSHFTNPDGWDDDNQYTTAHDLLLLTMTVLDHEMIQEIVKTPKYKAYFASGENAEWVNSNKLLQESTAYYSANCIGVKTGTTPAAGNNLISAFQDTDKWFIVLLGCDTAVNRYNNALELYQSVSKA